MTSSAKDLSPGIFALLSILSFLSVVANALVLLVIIIGGIKKPIKSTNSLIGNLAFTDLVFSGISMPLTLAATTMSHSWSMGNPGCKLVMFLPNFCIAASILTMIVIAEDRRVAVIHSRPRFHSRNAIVLANLTIWVLSLAVAAPALYEYSVYEKEYYSSGSGEIRDESGSHEMIELGSGVNPNDTILACGSHGIAENFEKVYAGILFVLIYLLPLVIISADYFMIGLFIRQKANEISANLTNGTGGSGGGALSKGKYKVLKMLVLLVFVFAVCWAPYFTIFVREELTGTDDTAKWGSVLHIMKLVMAVTSSLLNPIIYAAFNSKFRVGFKAVFKCRCSELINNRVDTVNTVSESVSDTGGQQGTSSK